MNPIRILPPALIAIALASCGSSRSNSYDTPSAAAASSGVNAPISDASNPVYDTPAAYEESSSTSVAPIDSPNIAISPAAPAAPSRPVVPANGAGTIHTVVAGDTLSGISAKYKIPAASIKQANGMTKDTVVLGRKMVIPPQ